MAGRADGHGRGLLGLGLEGLLSAVVVVVAVVVEGKAGFPTVLMGGVGWRAVRKSPGRWLMRYISSPTV